MYALIDQFKLYYQLDGDTQGFPLVFLNSLGCTLHIWDKVIPAFTGQYRLIRYDARGHGLSDAPPGPYTLRDETNDLASLLRSLEIDKVTLIGVSIGGLTAMNYALQYPEQVRALVVSDTAPRISTPELWEERISAVNQRGLPKMAETIVSRWFLPGFRQIDPEEYNEYLNQLSRTSQEGYIATCAALRDADLSSAIETIRAPLLALCGAGDVVVTPEQTRKWADCLPDARVQVIDGAAHLPCIEQPVIMANAIQQFLQEGAHA